MHDFDQCLVLILILALETFILILYSLLRVLSRILAAIKIT